METVRLTLAAIVVAIGSLVAIRGFGDGQLVIDAGQCGTNLLVNPSFDDPPVASGWRAQPEATMPGWTAEPGTAIEVWASGFLGFTASSGANLIEINYTGPTLIFQDIATNAGDELTWSSHHQNRGPNDEVEVVIGAPGALVQLSATQAPTSAWLELSGTYVVPPGQTTTRYGVRSISGGGAGNLADDLYLGVSCSPAEPAIEANDDSFVFSGEPLDLGLNDTITYESTFTLLLPAGLGTVVVGLDGVAVYNPNPGASGTDSFTYQLCHQSESGEICDPAIVTVELPPPG